MLLLLPVFPFVTLSIMIVSGKGGSVKEMAMKLTTITSVLSFVILAMVTLLPTMLNTAPQDQPQSATAPDHSTLRLWEDPGRIDDLQEVIFDFDTHESASEQAILEGAPILEGTSSTSLPFRKDGLKRSKRS